MEQHKMWLRVLLSIGAWSLGALRIAADGQVYTQSVIVIGCCLGSCLPWLPLLRRTSDLGRFVPACAFIGLNALVITAVATSLPAAYEQQLYFNDRSTPLDVDRGAHLTSARSGPA